MEEFFSLFMCKVYPIIKQVTFGRVIQVWLQKMSFSDQMHATESSQQEPVLIDLCSSQVKFLDYIFTRPD